MIGDLAHQKSLPPVAINEKKNACQQEYKYQENTAGNPQWSVRSGTFVCKTQNGYRERDNKYRPKCCTISIEQRIKRRIITCLYFA